MVCQTWHMYASQVVTMHMKDGNPHPPTLQTQTCWMCMKDQM
jgi:hypothetical protein